MITPRAFIPRAYQNAGVHFLLSHDRGMMAVDMGLGKSVMVLSAIDAYIRCGDCRPSLIIAPLRVAQTTWVEEARKWLHTRHLEVVPIIGDAQQRLDALRREAPIHTVNYENLPWLVEQWGTKWPYRTVVADESTRLKSHRAHLRKRTDGGSTICCTGGVRTTALARVAFKKTLRFWDLTGTPAPNSLLDLWGQVWYLDGGERLGRSFAAFQDRWFKIGHNGYDVTALPHAEAEIRAAIADITFALRAEDYLDLGEEVVNTIFIDMPPQAKSLYRAMEKHLYIEIQAGSVEAFSAAAKSIKLHQLANGGVYYDDQGSFECTHDAKIEALRSVIEEANGAPILVAYQFKSDLARLQKAFPQGKALDSSGRVEYAFKKGEVPILFIHPASAGHGIDGFQAVTNTICFFSVDWDAGLRSQAIARIGKVRQFQSGFERPVMIHQIIARGTVDEDILERIEGKISVEDALKRGLARRNLRY